MNGLEKLLNTEITHLLDRLATSAAGGPPPAALANPTLRARMNDMEVTLATLRTTLFDDYGRWTRALDDLENVWALAVWISAASEEAGETPAAPLAA